MVTDMLRVLCRYGILCYELTEHTLAQILEYKALNDWRLFGLPGVIPADSKASHGLLLLEASVVLIPLKLTRDHRCHSGPILNAFQALRELSVHLCIL